MPAPASASASASDESHAADAVAAGGRRGGDRGLRLLGENVSNPALQLQEELDQCRADLNELRKKQDAPALFFVQMASSCKMKAKTRKNGKVYYEWSSKEMDDETYSFTDRPYRFANTEPSEQFFKKFDTAFGDDSGGKPNGVITFRHEDTDTFEGPLISVFVEAAYRKDSGKYVYELSQSEDQEEVNALKDFFRKGEGKDNDVVEYEMCSIFIDSIRECGPTTVEKCTAYDCVKDSFDGCWGCSCYDPRALTYCINVNGDDICKENPYREDGTLGSGEFSTSVHIMHRVVVYSCFGFQDFLFISKQ